MRGRSDRESSPRGQLASSFTANVLVVIVRAPWRDCDRVDKPLLQSISQGSTMPSYLMLSRIGCF